jgi:ligand-binding sensor domain-containing protein
VRAGLALALVVSSSLAAGLATASELPGTIADYTVTSWGDVTNLDANAVWSIVQDHTGYLWLGTDGGLVRFDGTRFDRRAAVDNRLPPHGVGALHVSRDSSLWVGFINTGGLMRLNGGDLRVYDERDGLGPTAVISLTEDLAGTMWAATRQSTHQLSGDRWVRTQLVDDDGEGAVLLVQAAPDGRIFVATESAVFARDARGESFHRLEESEEPVEGLSVGPDGSLWRTAGTVGARRVGERPSPAPWVRGHGNALLHDRHGNLWVGTAGEGVWLVHRPPRKGRSARR